MQKIKSFLTIIIVILLFMILANVLYSKFIKKDKVISLLGKSFFVVETGSMEPNIKAGELVIITQKDKYDVNDIVTIIDDEDYIYTHRIVYEDEKNVITKGDGNSIDDESISKEHIIGKVIYHSKILGYFVLYILKPLICLYIMIIVITNIVDLNKKENNNEENSSN